MTQPLHESARQSAAAALWPGPLFVLGVLGWWALRGAGLYAMRAFAELEFEPLELGLGLLYDALIVWSVFLILRARHSLAVRGGLPRAGRALWGLAALLLLAMTTLRVGDDVVCYFALAHVTQSTWYHIAPGAMGYAFDPRIAALLGAIVAIVAVMMALSARAVAAMARHRPDGLSGRAAAGLQLTAAALCWAIPVAGSAARDIHSHHWALVPEVNAIATLLRSREGAADRARPESIVVPKLADATVADLRRAGLLSRDQDPNGGWPLLRRGIGPVDELPVRAGAEVVPVAGWRATGRRPPNVLIILVESLSGGFSDLDPRCRHQGLMPNLRRFAADMTLVSGFHNITSPTAGGLLASLCSALPSNTVQEIDVGGSVDDAAAFNCIADLLREHGYVSNFARGASKVYMACEATLRGHGFDRVTGREDLRSIYPDRPTNSWGYYDDTLVDFLLDDIDRLRREGRPWLYTTLTVDTHLPGFPEPDCPVPARWRSEKLLAGYHCTDRALGKLLDGLRARGVFENTLIVITGDHAPLPTRRIRELIGVEALNGAFAPIPLLIHDPLHRLPRRLDRLSGQLDLVPTLLHLLGVPTIDLHHSLLGWSIFGERRRHPFLAGRIGGNSGYVESASSRRIFALGTLPGLCERAAPLLPDGSSPVSPCELLAWFRWLDAVWAGHRLYPADRYDGGVDADLDLLRLKWLRYDRKEENARLRKGVRERLGRPPLHPVPTGPH